MAPQNKNPMSAQSNTPAVCYHITPPDPSHTCQHPHHAGYSESHLPPVLFRLHMPPLDCLPALNHLTENGRIVRDITGSPIRDFQFLPRYISVRPPGWLLEFWSRMDRRLTYKDIKARMTAPINQQPADNLLNVRREREARGPLGLSCRFGRHGEISRVEVERVERWSLDQIYFNTTMVVEYYPLASGKRMPVCLRAKMLQEGSPKYYPLNTFLDHQHVCVPSPRVLASISLLWRLAQRARELGLETWQVLPEEELPRSWKSVPAPKKFSYFNTKEYDNGIYALPHQNRRIMLLAANAQAVPADNAETAEEQGPVSEEAIRQTAERCGNVHDTQMKNGREDPSDDDLPLILRRHRVLKAARANASTRTVEGRPGNVPSMPTTATVETSSDEDMPLILRRNSFGLQMKCKRTCS